MSAAHHAQLLARMRDCARRGEVFSASDLAEFAAKVDRYFSQRCSLDEAMGVQLDRGENHPGATLAIETRDIELRAAAAKLGQISWANSKKLAALMESYWSRSWQRERILETCPVNRDGRIEGHFWRALRAFPKVVGDRQMHNITATQREVRSAFDFTENGRSIPGTGDLRSSCKKT